MSDYELAPEMRDALVDLSGSAKLFAMVVASVDDYESFVDGAMTMALYLPVEKVREIHEALLARVKPGMESFAERVESRGLLRGR